MATRATVASSRKEFQNQISDVDTAAASTGAAESAQELTRQTKEAAAHDESYSNLKQRAEAAESKLASLQAQNAAQSASAGALVDHPVIPGHRRRRRWTTSGSDISGEASASASIPLASSTNGELAAAAVQSAPLTLQLMIPLLMLLLLFGFFSLLAYALDFKGRRNSTTYASAGPGRVGHRRMPSGEAPLGDMSARGVSSNWSPRRGFSYSSSWSRSLSDAEVREEPSFSLTPSYSTAPMPTYHTYELPERVEQRRSPSRGGAEECRRSTPCNAV